MSSYWRSRYPTISEKLASVSYLHVITVKEWTAIPFFVVDLVTESGGVDNGERNASTLLVEF